MPNFSSNSSAWRLSSWALASGLAVMPIQAQAKTFHTDTVFAPDAAGEVGPSDPNGGLAADAQGRLYGVTNFGGASGTGTVYRLTPGQLKSDPWTSEVLHSFTGSEGGPPVGRLYIDSAGAVFGTTLAGAEGSGIIYRLDNAPGWPITIFHAFSLFSDAHQAQNGLALGKDGFLYGTSLHGGLTGNGTVFAISPLGDSVYYQVIHSFAPAVDGYEPTAFTIQGDGAIYGISYSCASGVCHAESAVFRLVEKDGIWRNTEIYTPQTDVLSSILLGPNNTLYLCDKRGKDGYVIKLSAPPSSGPWMESDLYRFERHVMGCVSLTANPSGGFVGTTASSSVLQSSTLFSLVQSLPSDSVYTFRTLHRFPDLYETTVGALLRLGGLYYGVTGITLTNGGTAFDVRP